MKLYTTTILILVWTAFLSFQAFSLQAGQSVNTWEEEMQLLEKKGRSSILELRNKATALNEQKNYKEAYEAFSDLIQLQDSLEQNHYIQKINQFKTEQEAKQNKVLNEQLSTKSHYLYFLIFVLLLFVAILTALIIINRKLKHRLLLTRQKAEHSDRLKNAFLANMNHEIRTPLNAIAGFSQLLVGETDPEMSEQYISIIKSNNDLLMNLLNDVLDMSRIESDTITFTYSKVYLPQLINGLCEVAKLQMPSAVVMQKDTCPELYISTDKNRLIQVLSNLISNAVKHTSEGSITVGYELCDDKMVHFYVTDTGEGISPELQNKIFARFVQAVEAHSKGVGLGLALCKGFVEHLGGEIGVESEAGRGSTFWFTLPYNNM